MKNVKLSATLYTEYDTEISVKESADFDEVMDIEYDEKIISLTFNDMKELANLILRMIDLKERK